ncbi:L,D-transpeptidase [Pseudonocardia sp. TRM90224]|uniref:L,D-transpeptidase n=1 Tax=Pseudonocardia sp. TRM90224 TaxID=2812678 RepID=UPI001E2B3238|nr:L,D-transpeptidase [Pseudonocardia sp. TRM90224]
MGMHSKATSVRTRALVAAGLVGLGALGSVGAAVGTAQAEAPRPVVIDGTPCTGAPRACVDLDEKQAWLIENGEIVRGPVAITSGGDDTPTPRGNHKVQWKNKDHHSSEFDDAPMPYAVFFAEGGIAFHEGSTESRSAGCIRMDEDDASAFYDFLQVGDGVQVR